MLHSITEQMWQNKKSMLSLHLLSSGFPNGNSEAKLSLWSRCVFVVMCSVRILRWLLLQKENVLHQRCKMCWKKDKKKKSLTHATDLLHHSGAWISDYDLWERGHLHGAFCHKAYTQRTLKVTLLLNVCEKRVKRRVRGQSWLNEMLRYFFPIEV